MTLFICFVLAWLAGILSGLFYSPHQYSTVFVLACGSMGFSLLLYWKAKGKADVFITLAAVIASGAGTGFTYYKIRNPDVLLESNATYIYSGRVKEVKNWGKTAQVLVGLEPVRRENTLPASLPRILLKSNAEVISGSLYPGNLIQFSTTLDSFPRIRGMGQFNERMYWAGQGISRFGWIRQNSLSILDVGQVSKIRKWGEKSGEQIGIEINKLGLSEHNTALLLAMISGDKSRLEAKQKGLFAQLGIMHLLAVSGLHMGLVYLIMNRLLMVIGLPKRFWLNLLLSTIMVWIYGFVCGFPPSSVRAATMLTIYNVLQISNRPVKGYQVVFLVAFLHSLINPAAVFSSGFQLSYLAVLGIVLYYNKIHKFLHSRFTLVNKMGEMMAMSLSAQVFTWPLSIYLFGIFPVWFLISNLLLVPVGILLFYLSLAAILLNQISGFPAILFLGLDLLFDVWIKSGQAMSHLPGGLIEFRSFPWVAFFGFSALLLLLRTNWQKILIQPGTFLLLILIWSLCGFFNIFVPNLMA